MARFRRSLRMRPVMSVKHIVDAQNTLAKTVVLPIVLVQAGDAPTLGATTVVATGSTVNAVYLRVEVSTNEAPVVGAVPNFYMIVYKNPGGNLGLPDPATTGNDDEKRFIIHQEMVMFDNSIRGGNPRTVFQGVIKIPKGYRRFGYNDLLQVIIKSPSIDVATCLQCIYKEYR